LLVTHGLVICLAGKNEETMTNRLFEARIFIKAARVLNDRAMLLNYP
jgi:hypothetical protein